MGAACYPPTSFKNASFLRLGDVYGRRDNVITIKINSGKGAGATGDPHFKGIILLQGNISFKNIHILIKIRGAGNQGTIERDPFSGNPAGAVCIAV
jgi:hypothetical protein